MRLSLFLFASASTFAQGVINDVTQLNPIPVARVVTPTSIEQIVAEVKANPCPISIGGGRFSMGGQTATQGALQLDMRQFDRVIDLDRQKKEITVQAGITWRKIQEFIDPHQLSLQVMQSYANFTVGGALSVNAHGRYMGMGPAVLSVKSIRLVLANGDVVLATPDTNRELFYGAIGGYGAMGVIAEATLRLADNVKVERRTQLMPFTAYADYFQKQVRGKTDIIFHNADMYPDAFESVRVTSYVKTDKPVTVADRLIPIDRDYRTLHWMHLVNSEWPGGKLMRQFFGEPFLNRGEKVVWRNYEASYNVQELEPASREKSTYVLQEFFIPVGDLNSFAPKMVQILQRHNVNTINISIRHAYPDPGTLLAWAREEVFAFVLYYKQGTSHADRHEVAMWTRELIDAAIAHRGAYYLPYQIWGTDQQFHKAYPRADEFFALKAKVDPTYKFYGMHTIIRLTYQLLKPQAATPPNGWRRPQLQAGRGADVSDVAGMVSGLQPEGMIQTHRQRKPSHLLHCFAAVLFVHSAALHYPMIVVCGKRLNEAQSNRETSASSDRCDCRRSPGWRKFPHPYRSRPTLPILRRL